MITLEQLIAVTPFSEEMRKEILEKLPTLSESQKFEMMDLCWQTINFEYQNKIDYAFQKATLEMAQGEKTYSKEDFRKMEDEIFDELVKKLAAAGTEVALEDVRQKLGQFNPPKQTPKN